MLECRFPERRDFSVPVALGIPSNWNAWHIIGTQETFVERIHELDLMCTEHVARCVAQVGGSADGVCYYFIVFPVCPAQTVNVRQGLSFLYLL